MVLDFVFLIISLLMIIYGANYLTDGASAIAKKMGISDLVVGLTIVAFGTSAPELAISIISAAQENAGIAIGNVVGSNIFNTLLIIGSVALIKPIKVEKNILTTEIPFMIIATVALVAVGCSEYIGAGLPQISRATAILFILFFLIFMRYVYSTATNKNTPDSEKAGLINEKGEPERERKMWLNVVYVLGGLAALIIGGDLFVDNASSIARTFGVSDVVIGLTIVAIGTSLPEFATSIVAARKGNSGMAVGNVIGSNIFNIFLVLGCAGVVNPLPFEGVSLVDLGTLLVSAVLFLMFGWLFGNKVINRYEGGLLACCYVGYICYVIFMAL